MRKCKECGKEFHENKSYEKYCTHRCCEIFNRKKRTETLRADPELRNKKNEYERLRRARVGRKRNRVEHNAAEKARYRRIMGIKSDADLKCAPKGSGTLTTYGYRQIYKHGHPNCRKDGAMFEHVFIMSEHLGRPIKKGETVHHKNGIRNDNRIENLELWSSSHPYGQRVEDKILWAKEFLIQYGYSVINKEKSKKAKKA